MKINQFAIAAVATLLMGSSLVAQQPGANQPAKDSLSRQQQGDSAQKNDQAFAKCLAIAQQEQIELARFAQGKATNAEVKRFAATMEKEHQSCLEQLNKISSMKGSSKNEDKSASTNADSGSTRERIDSTRERNNATREENTNAVTTTSTSAGGNDSSVDFLELKQEISTQCLKDSTEYLSQKEDADFDKCFVAMQIAKHAGMHSTLTVLQRHATGKLQTIITDGLEKNTQHMETAVTLMKQLETNDPATLTQSAK